MSCRTTGKIIDTYWTMGRYDTVVHFDAPSHEAMRAFTLDNAQQGNVRPETFRAFTREELAKILQAIQTGAGINRLRAPAR